MASKFWLGFHILPKSVFCILGSDSSNASKVGMLGPCYGCHSYTEPIFEPTDFYHLIGRLVLNSDPHCTFIPRGNISTHVVCKNGNFVLKRERNCFLTCTWPFSCECANKNCWIKEIIFAFEILNCVHQTELYLDYLSYLTSLKTLRFSFSIIRGRSYKG